MIITVIIIRVSITKNSKESLIENNFAIPVWWTNLLTTIKLILNKNISYESIENNQIDNSVSTTNNRSASLIASLQLSTIKTLSIIYKNQLLSSSYQSLHLFTCSSIENGIILGAALVNAMKSLIRMIEFSDLSIKLSTTKYINYFGELYVLLAHKEDNKGNQEIQLFCNILSENLDEIFQTIIQMIQKDKLKDTPDILREYLNSIIRYCSVERCQVLQVSLISINLSILLFIYFLIYILIYLFYLLVIFNQEA